MSGRADLPFSGSHAWPHSGAFYFLFPHGRCLQSGKRPAVFSLDGSMAALAGRHPPVQTGQQRCAVRGGLLLGRCGLSRRYGVVAHTCAAAVPCSRSIERSGTGAVPNAAGLYQNRSNPRYAGKAAAGLRAGHPHRNRHLRGEHFGLSGSPRRTVSQGCASETLPNLRLTRKSKMWRNSSGQRKARIILCHKGD